VSSLLTAKWFPCCTSCHYCRLSSLYALNS
jgi:biotin synthase-like enzyme